MKRKKKVRLGRPSLGIDGRTVLLNVKVSRRETVYWRAKAKTANMALGPWLLKERRDEMAKDKRSGIRAAHD